MPISLPALFESKLSLHAKEKSIVYSCLSLFEQWFDSNGTPVFFRDYTDHGSRHISDVLATAAALVTPDAASVLTAADIAIFTLATLLHDAALHLAEPGFHQLILGDARDRRIVDLDESTWPELWNEFLFTAKRWDDGKRKAVLGEDKNARAFVISDPFERWDNLTVVDQKIIGEFIRLYHPRLAHEFSVFGIPGLEATGLKLPSSVPEDWRDLAGVVARSHGMSLRPCVDRIARTHHVRDYQGVHAVYLMALLRLSDYLQLDSGRAPSIVFKYRVIPSLNSQLEWRAHHAVKNITPEHEDPESVQIDADPKDVNAYLRVRSWLDGIQAELDQSWAVLGEVYGRYATLKELRLHWRRVRSNLDDRRTFAKSVAFLPQRVRMEVARSELLSLLIRPLYGDDPSYGIRELIQNAVDAVREREYFEDAYPQMCQSKARVQSADVFVWLSDWDSSGNCAWLEVSDNGIGMNERVLTEYFLTAGASYRHSKYWQTTFESGTETDGVKPRAKVLRSGRFGVGALAAFLLGDEVETETRHVTSTVGYRFKMHLNDDAIQVDRVDDLPTGTKIRVRVGRDAYDKLQKQSMSVSKPRLWDWYVLDKPSVMRVRGNAKRRLANGHELKLNKWHDARTNLPLKVFWKFYERYSRVVPRLACNGIYVSDAAKLPAIRPEHCGSQRYFVETPCLHVMDADGILPLGLTRKEIVDEEYGFETDLAASIIHDFFARLLCTFPETPDAKQMSDALKHPFQKLTEGWSKLLVQEDATSSLLFGKKGFSLPFRTAFSQSPDPICKLLWVDRMSLLKHGGDLSTWDCVLIENDFLATTASTPALRLSQDVEFVLRASNAQFWRCTNRHTVAASETPVEIEYKTWILPDQSNLHREWATWKDDAGEKVGKYSDRKTIPVKTSWLVETEGMPVSQFAFDKSVKSLKKSRFRAESVPFVAECLFQSPLALEIDGDFIGQWWTHFFGSQWLPWKREERLSKFPKATKELAPYIKHYLR